MISNHRSRTLPLTMLTRLTLLALLWIAVQPVTVSAYVEIPYTLGRVVMESTSITLLKIEKVDKERNLILFRKVKDLKGTQPGEVIKHNIGRGGFHEREWKAIMEYAEPGKTALFFNNGGASETCIANYWYQAYTNGDWWNMSHGEPYMLRSYAGTADKLAAIVTAMLTGQEVVVPCMVDGDKMSLQLRTARIQRLRASLKIQDYNATRDFAGWGGDDFRTIAGMPPFSHYAGVSRTDPEAQGVTVADIDGDGKNEFCFYGLGKVALLKVDGPALSEISLPITTGARWAGFADFNGDKKLDLLLATPQGPRLLTGQGGNFKDESHLLPSESYYQLTAATWINYDGDAHPDILLANGFLGLRLYRNLGAVQGEGAAQRQFVDLSEQAGLGAHGLGAALRQKGDHLAVADVNGDGRDDFLYTIGTGLLALNSSQGFTEAKESGLSFVVGKVRPVFADWDGDQKPDLFVPQNGVSKLWANRAGKFVDVTASSGDLNRALGEATCATGADFDGDGRLDLLIGCTKGPNRLFRNAGQGKFVDGTLDAGLLQRIFNTRGIAMGDINADGIPDLLLNNEGQESSVLLRAAAQPAAGQVGRNP
jgi:hypothetical protein